jgi:2-polyprenyl-3-methyl-5-hydroxy-6-metoxy-1,4-benzoquinol methylase
VKAGDWDARYAERPLVWSAEPNRFVEREVAALPPGRALDLGCGEGRNALWLATLGWTVRGIDFSSVAIERGRQRAAEAGLDVDLRVRDVLDLEDNAAFDLVLLSYLQLVPPERSVVLRAAARALAPGGTFLLVAHDLRNLEEGHGGPQDASVLWSVAEVVAALRPTLVVEHAAVEERPVDDAPRPALDTIVRARRPD